MFNFQRFSYITIAAKHCLSSMRYIVCVTDIINRGGDLGGDGPPKFEVGGRPMHWPPPQIFREVVLSDARQSMNRVKKRCFVVRKWSNNYDI